MTRGGVLQRPDGARLPWEILGDGGGDGRRLAFAHNLTGRGVGAGPVLAPLVDDGWTVLAADVRGHGVASPLAPGGDFALPTLGADMLALLDAAAWDDAWLGGGSMGAAIALATAAAAPQRVRGLVLIAPAIGARPNPALGGLDIDVAALTGQPVHSWRAVLAGMAGWQLSDELRALRALDVRVHVLAWRGDPVHPMSVAEELCESLTGARLRVIEPYPDPAQYFRDVVELTRRRGRPAPP